MSRPLPPHSEHAQAVPVVDQVLAAARRVSELARQRPGRLAEVGLKVPLSVSSSQAVELMAAELARLGLPDVRVTVNPGGRLIELDTVEFEP